VVSWCAKVAAARTRLLPAAALLSALGFAVIWRLKPDLAVEQVTWLGVGLVAFVLTLMLIRDDRYARRLHVHDRTGRVDPALATDRPRAGPDDQRRAALGGDRPDLVPTAEFGKVLIVLFLASYLADKREMLAAAQAGSRSPREGPRPADDRVGHVASPPVLGEGSGRIAAVLRVFVVMLWIASGRPMFLIVGLALFVVGAWIGYLALSHVAAARGLLAERAQPDKVYQLG
jgi:cell division protein FtsW (lipid II flippase)